MKRYTFRLEAALRARRAEEEGARQRLAEVNRRVQRARAAHAAALDAYRVVAASPLGGPGEEFLAARAREMRLAEAVERARRAVSEVEVEAATLHALWVETAKRVASLDRLDARRREEWRAEMLRDEAAAVDDVVTSRWTPAGRAGMGGR